MRFPRRVSAELLCVSASRMARAVKINFSSSGDFRESPGMPRLAFAVVCMISLLRLEGVSNGEPNSAQAAVENGLRPSGTAPGSPTFSIEDRMRFYHVPGVSVAVIDDGKIEWAKGYGVIQTGQPAPVTTETRFQACSVSKPVASMGALALVEKGKLSLDAPVNSELRTASCRRTISPGEHRSRCACCSAILRGPMCTASGGYPARCRFRRSTKSSRASRRPIPRPFAWSKHPGKGKILRRWHAGDDEDDWGRGWRCWPIPIPPTS